MTRPVLLLAEDLHWLDDETLAFLDALIEGLPEAPLLLLVTYRPEHRHGWGGRSFYPDQALASLGGALALVQERPHPFSLAVAQVFAAMLHQFRREAARARHWAEAALPITTDHGFPLFRGMAAMLRGWALFDQGARDEGMGQLTQGFETIRATGAELLAPYFLGLLADAQRATGPGGRGVGDARPGARDHAGQRGVLVGGRGASTPSRDTPPVGLHRGGS